MEWHLRIQPKPFPITCAGIKGSRPSIGAHQYIDPHADRYTEIRWPICVDASIEIDGFAGIGQTQRDQLLLVLMDMLWSMIKTNALVQSNDQIVNDAGYRRTYRAVLDTDILGHRRPSPSNFYHLVKRGDFVGPGLASVEFPGETPTEFYWSQVIPLPGAQGLPADRPRLDAAIELMKLHFRSFHEIADAQENLNDGAAGRHVRNAVRAAASAIDALRRFHADLRGIQIPRRSPLPFNEQIDEMLRRAGLPTYASVNRAKWMDLLWLYRSRNSMHEAACWYTDSAGTQVEIDHAKAAQLVASARDFMLWIDALA